MTMMGRSRDSKAGLRLFLGGAIILGALFVLFFNTEIGAYARGFLSSIIALRGGNAEYAALSKDALIDRLSSAESELMRAKYQAILYDALAEENARLRDAAGAVALSPRLTARVIARPPQTLYDTLIIDQGAEAGVRERDSATYQGIALGHVVTVDAKTSVVQLFSSSGALNDAILGEPRAVAVAKGQGGGAFESSLPQGIVVAVGDTVRFPASESLILGVVKSVSADPRDASQTVRFAIPVSFADLDFIQIVPAR